ncbi:MAG: hypothetical protein DRJ51_02430 [Thermoprotei archaeon]|nr:MAG: hypothetical protein DRJ51_02430 [Thermoprotei archaeon]
MSSSNVLEVSGGICAYCGACVSICSTSAIYLEDDKIAIRGEKCTRCGLCVKVCPAINIEIYEPPVIESYTARSTIQKVLEVCQDGGVVTALLMEALKRGLVDIVIVCGESETERLKPRPFLANSPEDVLIAAGSKYSLSPILNLLEEAISRSDKVAIVGLPCHLRALELMRKAQLVEYTRAIRLKIGLFCMNNYPYANLIKIIAEVAKAPLSEVNKVEIRKGKFIVWLRTGVARSAAITEFKEYVNVACKTCPDFTAWFSDISVGSAGSEEGWSTVLIRSETGRNLFNMAVKEGVITAKSLSEKALNQVRRLAGVKLKRALGSINQIKLS